MFAYTFKTCLLLFYLLSPLAISHAEEATPPQRSLIINLFAPANGHGLEKSAQILKNALVKLGHTVYLNDWKAPKPQDAPAGNINIFFELINTSWLNNAPTNWFICNPEGYGQGQKLLNSIDLFLCRTREIEKIFTQLKKKTYFLSFSSFDCTVPTIEKDFSQCLHAAGGSWMKGTDKIIKAWLNDLSMPQTTILRRGRFEQIAQENLTWITTRISENDLRDLQNRYGIHLCPSETEGWGHYIAEAMSASAVVVTTDAPPMNEFITDKRCLVAYSGKKRSSLATSYFADPQSLKTTIQNLMMLPREELQKIGENNRLKYLEKTQEFHDNLEKLMNVYLL